MFDVESTRPESDSKISGMVDTALLGDGAEQRSIDTDDEGGIFLLHFPAAGGVRRDNVDIAMHGQSAMTFPTPAARDVDGGPKMDDDSGAGTGGGVDYSWLVGGDADCECVGSPCGGLH